MRPRTVFLGGDPSGQVQSISWRNWGNGRAAGFGEGWCPGSSVASGHPCLASLHIYGLGTCHGRRAYTALALWFKQGGSWTAVSKWNICNGQSLP